jgi:hypothetical protein
MTTVLMIVMDLLWCVACWYVDDTVAPVG